MELRLSTEVNRRGWRLEAKIETDAPHGSEGEGRLGKFAETIRTSPPRGEQHDVTVGGNRNSIGITEFDLRFPQRPHFDSPSPFLQLSPRGEEVLSERGKQLHRIDHDFLIEGERFLKGSSIETGGPIRHLFW